MSRFSPFFESNFSARRQLRLSRFRLGSLEFDTSSKKSEMKEGFLSKKVAFALFFELFLTNLPEAILFPAFIHGDVVLEMLG